MDIVTQPLSPTRTTLATLRFQLNKNAEVYREHPFCGTELRLFKASRNYAVYTLGS